MLQQFLLMCFDHIWKNKNTKRCTMHDVHCIQTLLKAKNIIFEKWSNSKQKLGEDRRGRKAREEENFKIGMHLRRKFMFNHSFSMHIITNPVQIQMYVPRTVFHYSISDSHPTRQPSLSAFHSVSFIVRGEKNSLHSLQHIHCEKWKQKRKKMLRLWWKRRQ